MTTPSNRFGMKGTPNEDTHLIIKDVHQPALELLTVIIQQDKTKLPKRSLDWTHPRTGLKTKVAQLCEHRSTL